MANSHIQCEIWPVADSVTLKALSGRGRDFSQIPGETPITHKFGTELMEWFIVF
jgi:hypothetical protein